MGDKESSTEKQEEYRLRRKVRRWLDSIESGHMLIASLILTAYTLSHVDIKIINDDFVNFIVPSVVVFLICDNALNLLIDVLRKITTIDMKSMTID